MKLAVVLFNLGGPDNPSAVKPFLQNLFSDPAIISLPGIFRFPLARLVAARRAPVASAIYAQIGGRSPIVEESEAQARALTGALRAHGHEARCFVAMRYWHPFIEAVVSAVKTWGPEHVVLLPLYPQYSTTTTASSLAAWEQEARKCGLNAPETRICCYPWDDGFTTAQAGLVARALERMKRGLTYRLLFSAHGLPRRIVARGDPYQWQVERSAEAILRKLALPQIDWRICYQSRVGPLQWIGPATDEEIRRAGEEGKGVIVVPIAFVSEHAETLVELDIEYAALARKVGVADYIRVPTVRGEPAFIEGLARLVLRALDARKTVTCAPARICPADRLCGFEPA